MFADRRQIPASLWVAFLLAMNVGYPALAEAGTPGPGTTACQSVPPTQITSFKVAHTFRVLKNATLFRIDHLVMDLDGTPTTYGVRDQGIDGICNGLASYTAPHICRSEVNADGCFKACQAALRDWNTQGQTVEAAHRLLCSVGIGSGCGPTFSYSLQTSPGDRNGYFVSSTSLHYKEPNGKVRSVWLKTQDAQLNATEVPYFSLPPQLRSAFGIQLGDVGVMIRTGKSGAQPTFFIMGDGGSGKSVGEVSGRVRQQLSGLSELPKIKTSSAFGEMVNRVVAPSSPPVAIAIFSGTNRLVAGTSSILDLTSATINDWIAQRGESELASLGGVEVLNACTPDAPRPLTKLTPGARRPNHPKSTNRWS